MRIDIDNIHDKRLKSFLVLLKSYNIRDVLVVGGAVRDLFFSRPCTDIDISVRLEHFSPRTVKNYCNNTYVLHSLVSEKLTPLAIALKCDVEQFLKPIIYEGVTIDVLGLNIVEDDLGICHPDIFVDHDGFIFGARPDLTVNRLAIDTEGRIWPDSHVSDCQAHIARFTDAPLPMRLRQVVRALHVSQKLKLKFATQSITLLTNYFHSHVHYGHSKDDMEDEDTLNLIGSLQAILKEGGASDELTEIYDSFWETLY